MVLEALEALDGTTEIGGVTVGWDESGDSPIRVIEKENAISFKLQRGPIGENGVNGCQVDALLLVAERIIQGLNERCPSHENDLALQKIAEAVFWLEMRHQDRINRGVEGT